MIITCDCFNGVFELSKNHSHVSTTALHIVLRDEYIEGKDQYVRVAVHFITP